MNKRSCFLLTWMLFAGIACGSTAWMHNEPLAPASAPGAPTPTQTPWQTHSPQIQGFRTYGDSYTVGTAASNIGVNDWCTLLKNVLNQWYPTVTLNRDGIGGTTAYGRLVLVQANNTYQADITSDAAAYFAEWGIIWLGINEAYYDNSGCPDCYKNATLANATTYSQVFKTTLQYGVTIFQNSFPATDPILPTNTHQGQLFFCNIPDLSTAGGGGYVPYDPVNWADYTASLAQYNARINELAGLYSGVYVVDMHGALYGCSGCYDSSSGFPHPNDQGQTIINRTLQNAMGGPPR